MRLRKTLEFLGGSVAVYLSMVACASSSGAEKPEPIAETGGAHATGGHSAGGANSTGGNDGGFGFGGMMDPTPDAGATEAGSGPGPGTCECPEPPDPYVPPEPLVVEAECDVIVEVTANLDYAFAKIARPRGMADEQLFLGSAMLTYGSQPQYLPPGDFTRGSSGLMVSDDEVVVNCGSIAVNVAPPALSATFIFPR